MALLLLFVGFALGISFLCSLLEATLLSARVATLSQLSKAGSQGATRLLEIKQTRVDDAISAILILNTISNTLGATLAGAQASHVFGSAAVGVFSGVLTLLILVFSEIIPKTLGAVYTRLLSPFVGWALTWMMKVLAPVLVVSRYFTRMLTRQNQESVSRGELEAVIGTAAREGAISGSESTIFANLLRLKEVQVEDVMTPRTVMFVLPAEATVADLLAEREAEAFSRIPLYRGHHDEIIGYVLQRDVLQAATTGCDRGLRLDKFLRQIWFIPELISVGEALKQFLERREPIAMVTDEHGGVAGIVTLEDLTETILGREIVDESDRIIDMREAALELRDRRLERLRKKRELVLAPPTEDP